MNQMKDVEEFAICTDITSRMAIFAMAKSCSNQEIDMAFNVIQESLAGEAGYDIDKVSSLVDQYRNGVTVLKKGLSEEI